jgi:hypothetical protein
LWNTLFLPNYFRSTHARFFGDPPAFGLASTPFVLMIVGLRISRAVIAVAFNPGVEACPLTPDALGHFGDAGAALGDLLDGFDLGLFWVTLQAKPNYPCKGIGGEANT